MGGRGVGVAWVPYAAGGAGSGARKGGHFPAGSIRGLGRVQPAWACARPRSPEALAELASPQPVSPLSELSPRGQEASSGLSRPLARKHGCPPVTLSTVPSRPPHAPLPSPHRLEPEEAAHARSGRVGIVVLVLRVWPRQRCSRLPVSGRAQGPFLARRGLSGPQDQRGRSCARQGP